VPPAHDMTVVVAAGPPELAASCDIKQSTTPLDDVAGTYESVVCASAGAAFLDQPALAKLAGLTKPGGTVEVRELVWCSAANTSTAPRVPVLRDQAELRRAILYAGLSPLAVSDSPAVQPLQNAGHLLPPLVAVLYPGLKAAAKLGDVEAADALQALAAQLAPRLSVCVVRATSPSMAGASFSLKSRSLAAPQPDGPTAPAAATAWSALGPVSAVDGSTAELLDEDELLEDEDRAKKEAEMDCGTSNGGKRKACKNCSCGLREMVENEEANAPAPKSACGSCALGDAFRCASCPHLGKPAFAPGETLKLADSMLQSVIADGHAVIAVVSDSNLARGSEAPSSVVKLSLDSLDDVF